jgi:hypothetical protein
MLPYVSSNYINSGAGLAGNQVFSANGLFDPDITGTGSQPAGFDQMMLSYEHYTVLRAKITATFRNTSTANIAFAAIGVRADSVVNTSYDTIMTSGQTVATALMPSATSASLKELSLEVDIAVYGGVDDLMDNENYRGNIAVNPAEQTYFHLSAWNPESNTVVAVYYSVRIEYYSIFSEAKFLGLSLLKKLHSIILSDPETRTKRESYLETKFPTKGVAWR